MGPEEENSNWLKGIRVIGLTDKEHQDADARAKSTALSQLKKELETKLGRPITDKEAIDQIPSSAIMARAADLYISGFLAPAIKQGRSITIDLAKINADKKQIENLPEVRKEAIEKSLIPISLKHGMIELETLEKYRDRYNKHQDDIIASAIAAGKSPYEAMAGVANLGVMIGGIASILGQAMDKPEWVAFGAQTMSWSTQLATKAKDGILALDKEAGILKNISKTPPEFKKDMDDAQRRLVMQHHYTQRAIIASMADDPEQRRILLESWDKGFQALCAQHGIECDIGERSTPGAGNAPRAALNVRNNNPGNIRDIKTGQFRVFATPEEGLKAMHDDLMIKISGKSGAMKRAYGNNYSPTLENLINVWAPPNVDNNDTKAYIKRVSEKTGIDPKHVLTPADLKKLVPAMIWHEGGGEKSLSHFQPALDKKYAAADIPPVTEIGDRPVAVLNNPEASTTATAVYDALIKRMGVGSPDGVKQPYDAVAHLAQAPTTSTTDIKGLRQSAAALSHDGDTGERARSTPVIVPVLEPRAFS